VAVLVLLGLYALLAVRFYIGEPTVATDYLAQLNAPIEAVPADQRAWPVYREAMLGMGLDEWTTARDLLHTEDGEPVRPGDPGWPAVRAYLGANERHLDALRRAGAMPAMGWPVGVDLLADADASEVDPTGGAEVPTYTVVATSGLGMIRTAARVLARDVQDAADRGEMDRAVADVEALLRLARHTAEQPLLINAVVGLSVQFLAYQVVEELATEHAEVLGAEGLARLSAVVGQPDLAPAQLWDLAGERASFLDLVQRMYTDDGDGDGRLTDEGLRLMERMWVPPGMVEAMLHGEAFEPNEPGAVGVAVRRAAEPAALLLAPSRRELVAVYDSAVPAAPRGQLPDPHLPPELEAAGDGWADRARYGMALQVAPVVQSAARSVRIFEDRRRGVLAGLALERYRVEHGAYPGGVWEQAVPGYLEAAPVSAMTGEPLRWLVRDGVVVVYGLGLDGDDDGGVQPAEGEAPADGDWVVWGGG
jgi:hypothetical protein